MWSFWYRITIMLQSFRELIVWKKAFAFGLKVYKYTEDFPNHEKFGLVSQMRRSAVSIASNIAEGRRRSTRRDFANFLSNALASAAELETQILFSQGLNYLSPEKSAELLSDVDEISRMLATMRRKLLAVSF